MLISEELRAMLLAPYEVDASTQQFAAEPPKDDDVDDASGYVEPVNHPSLR
jgi:hypothetical protein